MEIIPAIDIMNGKGVRLTKGDYSTQKVYYDDPVRAAIEFEDHGIRRLHFVDLDGAKAGKVVNLNVLKNIADRTGLIIDFGGGVKSTEDLEDVFKAGASMVTAGTAAVKSRSLVKQWLISYGGERIILGADASEGRIAVSGWQENTEIGIPDFIGSYLSSGIKYVICTDIGRDGMLNGPASALYKDLIRQFPSIRFIASGGVTTLQDIETLQQAGLWGVILGKTIYEKNIEISDLKPFLT